MLAVIGEVSVELRGDEVVEEEGEEGFGDISSNKAPVQQGGLWKMPNLGR